MNLDFAPLEGITGAVFRRFHHTYFPGVDHYYAPFLSPTQDRRLTPRDLRELSPEYNEGIPLIPQILTKNSEDFLWAARELHAMGYEEINLNTGCPSGTVTAKGKGAGMLADPTALDQFLQEIFSKTPCRISVKTRLGVNNPEEFEAVLEVFDQYPLEQLIIHPRIRKDFYRHPVRTEFFDQAYLTAKSPLGYNGSIVTPEDHRVCVEKYPKLKSVMVGQGLVSDPFLAAKIKFGARVEKNTMKIFHDQLFFAYAEQFQSHNNAAQRMKELWFYWMRLFDCSQTLGKQLLKSRNAQEYLAVVNSIFDQLELLENSSGEW